MIRKHVILFNGQSFLFLWQTNYRAFYKEGSLGVDAKGLQTNSMTRSELGRWTAQAG